MKVALIMLLALVLCGCQGLKAPANQQTPMGSMTTGNWEFILQDTSTQNTYVESNISSTGTSGSYSDHGVQSTLFSIDTAVYYADPSAGGGYELGNVSSVTLTINGQLAVTGTINQPGSSPIALTGTVDSQGLTMTGTFDNGSGSSGSFTAASALSLAGDFYDGALAIGESLNGNTIAESSQNGTGTYNLTPSVGNFAFLASDIPVGGNGSVVFWNNTGVCNGNQCAVWLNLSTNAMWLLMNDPTSGTTQIVAVLRPPA
ncbi:MAG: hypothetical protein WBV46_14345 [Terriglobales bacterium]|jgi:hypothetical protein